MTSISTLITDPSLLGGYFRDASWARWKAVLKATFAEPPGSAEEVELFWQVAERPWPTAPVGELDAVIGRGGGKNSAAAVLAVHAALNVDPAALHPGEWATIFCFATDRTQAAISLRYITAFFEEVPLLTRMVAENTATGLRLTNKAEIVVGTSNYRMPRGRRIACAILDEACFLRGDESVSPDIEIDAALTPGLARHPGSIKVLISSAYTRDGLLYRRYKENYGRESPGALCVFGTTRDFNPGFSQSEIDKALASDYPRCAAEFLSVWRDDLAGFVSRPVLEALVDPLVTERRPDRRYSYFAFSDDSGGSQTASDASTFSIAHKDPVTDRIVQDVLRAWQPPFNATQVMAEKAALAKVFGLSTIYGDNWAAGLTETTYASHGITYERVPAKSALYSDFLTLVNSGRPLLLNNPLMISQFCALERRISFGSRTETIDHPPRDKFHDDLSNATAGACVLAAAEPGPLIITKEMIEHARRARPRRWRLDDFRSVGSHYS